MDTSNQGLALEDRLRGMILTNEAAEPSVPGQQSQSSRTGVPQPLHSEQSPMSFRQEEQKQHNSNTNPDNRDHPGQQSRRANRPNQAQRRQNAASDAANSILSGSTGQALPQQVPSQSPTQTTFPRDNGANLGYQRFRPDHMNNAGSQNQRPLERAPNMGMRQKGFSRQSQQQTQTYSSPVNGAYTQSRPQYGRPNPRNAQLYNPVGNQNQMMYYQQQGQAAKVAQNDFLNETLYSVAPSFTVTKEETVGKETLRDRLQEICCKAVIDHEQNQDPAFDVNSVDLRCFGSVGSGFAMPNSDMDLALLSPLSTPEPCSAESPIPRLLEKSLLQAGHGARLLTKTRVPIIRFCEKPTEHLRLALLEERQKWENEEKEKASDPKLKSKATKPRKSIEGNSKAGTNDEDSSETSSPLRDEDKSTPDTDKTNMEGNGGTNRAVGEKQISVEVAAVGTSNQGPKNERQEPKQFHIETEGEDENAPERSDEERVRLYKLAMHDGWYLPQERRIITRFVAQFNKHQLSQDSQELIQARAELKTLPNILKRHREPRNNPLDYPKSGVGTQCDINFSNFLALHNTKLLYCCSLCDARVKSMVLFIKSWAKRRKINSPYHGTLSSYGYVLMVLHYLINVAKPPVLPNLQHVPGALNDSPDNPSKLGGYDVRFWRDEAAIIAIVQAGKMNSNNESIGSLLWGFFHYFGTNNPPSSFDWMTQVLSLRTKDGGILTKAGKGWTGAKTVVSEAKNEGEEKKEVRHRYLFAIEDPFEIDHNVARTVVHNGIVAIRNEFRRAVSIIGSVRYSGCCAKDDLMAEAEEREHLQHKPFGHPPKGYGQVKAPVKDDATKNSNGIVAGEEKRRSLTVQEATAAANERMRLDRLQVSSSKPADMSP